MALHDRPATPEVPQQCDFSRHPALANVADALGRLRYGAIQLIVHDGRLVQIEVTERQRFA